MTPYEISDAALALLIRVLDEGHEQSPQTPDLRSATAAFCYRHGSNVANIGSDLIFLLTDRRDVGAKMLVRPMVESMFNIGAAFKNQNFAVEKMILEIEKEVRWLKRDFTNPDQSVLTTIQQNEAELAHLRQHFGNVIPERRWKYISEIAKEGGHERHYNKDYRYFCGYTHGDISGMLRHEEGVGRPNVFQTATMTMLCTASTLCGVLTVKDQLERLLESRELNTKLLEAIDNGSIAALDKKEAAH